MNNETVTIDVRDDIRNGREPFSKIMRALGELRARQMLLLVAPFRPVPLFGVLKKQGFVYNTRQLETGDWEVLLIRAGGKTEGQDNSSKENLENADSCERLSRKPARYIDVDARGLEPPQPMIKILETLADLPEDAGLCACTDRRPMHLYAQLKTRGFIGKSTEQNDGSFITHIRRI